MHDPAPFCYFSCMLPTVGHPQPTQETRALCCCCIYEPMAAVARWGWHLVFRTNYCMPQAFLQPGQLLGVTDGHQLPTQTAPLTTCYNMYAKCTHQTPVFMCVVHSLSVDSSGSRRGTTPPTLNKYAQIWEGACMSPRGRHTAQWHIITAR